MKTNRTRINTAAEAVRQARDQPWAELLDPEWVGVALVSGTQDRVTMIKEFESLLREFGVDLKPFRPAGAVAKLLGGYKCKDGTKAQATPFHRLTRQEQVDIDYYLEEDLFDLLDEIAPPGTTFGPKDHGPARPHKRGDAGRLEFGFWPLPAPRINGG